VHVAFMFDDCAHVASLVYDTIVQADRPSASRWGPSLSSSLGTKKKWPLSISLGAVLQHFAGDVHGHHP